MMNGLTVKLVNNEFTALSKKNEDLLSKVPGNIVICGIAPFCMAEHLFQQL